ncbi:Uncharacterised protein [Staphylococcus aureus]|nr:Uncharacterised protein [Staphylococcus aureus]
MISLNIILPTDVARIFLFCSSVNVGLLNELACTPILVCKCTKPFAYAFNTSFVLLKIAPVFTASFLSKVR